MSSEKKLPLSQDKRISRIAHRIEPAMEKLLYALLDTAANGTAKVMEEQIEKLRAIGCRNFNLQNESKQNALFLAARRGSQECVDCLLRNGASFNSDTSLHGELLSNLVVRGNQSMLSFLVKGKYVSLQVKDKMLRTPLETAVTNRQYNMVKLLLKLGATPDGRVTVPIPGSVDGSRYVKLLMGCALIPDDYKTAQCLIQHGADINQVMEFPPECDVVQYMKRDYYGAVYHRTPKTGTLLGWVLHKEHKEMMKWCIENQATADTDLCTRLYKWCIRHDDIDMMNFLSAYGMTFQSASMYECLLCTMKRPLSLSLHLFKMLRWNVPGLYVEDPGGSGIVEVGYLDWMVTMAAYYKAYDKAEHFASMGGEPSAAAFVAAQPFLTLMSDDVKAERLNATRKAVLSDPKFVAAYVKGRRAMRRVWGNELNKYMYGVLSVLVMEYADETFARKRKPKNATTEEEKNRAESKEALGDWSDLRASVTIEDELNEWSL